MKRLCTFGIVALFSVGFLEAQGLSEDHLQLRDVASLLDRNVQQLRSGEIRFIVRHIPSERTHKLLQNALRNPAKSVHEIALLKALATRTVSNVRLCFQGNKVRYEFVEEEKDGQTTHKRSGIWGYNGRFAWMHGKQERTGSLLKDRGAILYYDPRCPYLMLDPFTSWSTVLETLSRSPSASRAVVRRVPEGLLLDIPSATNEAYVQRLLVDPARGYLIKRSVSLAGKRITGKDEAIVLTEVQPSVWFPTKQIAVIYDDTGAELERQVLEVMGFRFNISIPENIFEPQFPPGTRVSDMVHDRVYVATTPLWTFRRTLVALVFIGLLVAFWWWRYRRLFRRTTG
jgi:hypothetical protein